MSRRNAAEKRPILPDPQFNSRLATMIVARLMKHGKKSTAQRILSDAFTLIGERTGADPLEVFETAVKNATPLVEVRARRVGGATYQADGSASGARHRHGSALAGEFLARPQRPQHGPEAGRRTDGCRQ
ncbi:MAG: ribosomal protein [Cyanobacteriota bacterium]